jgi:hypothetical protein
MGRPAHRPTEQVRTLVRRLSGLGLGVDDIGVVAELSRPTIGKYYHDALERGRVEANAAVAQALFKAATRQHNPSIPAAMFWLRNRAGWKESVAPGEAGAVHTLAIEFVGPRALVDAVRATQGPLINGQAHEARTMHDVAPEGSDAAVDEDADGDGADADADGEVGDMTPDDAALDLFEAPLPEPDPEP